jgi:hypothetical protein
MSSYELHYGTGGHGGPYPSLNEAVEAAVRLIRGSPSERYIYVFDRDEMATKTNPKAVMVVKQPYEPSKWHALHSRFNRLQEYTGADKSSSYVMNVIYDQDGEIGVELGTYDIADWPRSLYLGPFKDEFEALVMTELKIIEAERVVLKEKADDEQNEASENKHAE